MKDFKKIHEDNVIRWMAEHGDYTYRLDYDLNPDSIVLDVGGYLGDWAASIYIRYGCDVQIFEPVPAFADTMLQRFKGNHSLVIHPYGLSNHNHDINIALIGDASSIYKNGDTGISVKMRDVESALAGIEQVDIMKLNIEGGEFEVLERLIETGSINKIKNIQIQFHYWVDNYSARLESLQNKMSETHIQTWSFDHVWENWKLK